MPQAVASLRSTLEAGEDTGGVPVIGLDLEGDLAPGGRLSLVQIKATGSGPVFIWDVYGASPPGREGADTLLGPGTPLFALLQDPTIIKASATGAASRARRSTLWPHISRAPRRVGAPRGCGRHERTRAHGKAHVRAPRAGACGPAPNAQRPRPTASTLPVTTAISVGGARLACAGADR